MVDASADDRQSESIDHGKRALKMVKSQPDTIHPGIAALNRVCAILQTYPPRGFVEAIVGLLIENLDAIDGDADLEDSEASDPLVDTLGRWCRREPAPVGPWFSDDEESILVERI